MFHYANVNILTRLRCSTTKSNNERSWLLAQLTDLSIPSMNFLYNSNSQKSPQKPEILTLTIFLMKSNYFFRDVTFGHVPYFPQDRERSPEWFRNVTDGRKVTPTNRNNQEEQKAGEKNDCIASKSEERHGERGDITTKVENAEDRCS
jgi:hypothetical protein